MQYLMGSCVCVWYGICAKYLAFGTYLTSTMSAQYKTFCTQHNKKPHIVILYNIINHYDFDIFEAVGIIVYIFTYF